MDESCSESGRKHPSREKIHDSGGVEKFALAAPAAAPGQTPAKLWPQPDSHLALVLPRRMVVSVLHYMHRRVAHVIGRDFDRINFRCSGELVDGGTWRAASAASNILADFARIVGPNADASTIRTLSPWPCRWLFRLVRSVRPPGWA